MDTGQELRKRWPPAAAVTASKRKEGSDARKPPILLKFDVSGPARRAERERPYGPSAPPPAQSISSNFLTTDTSAGSQSTVSSVSFVSHFMARCSVKVISPDTTSHMKQCIVRWKVE